ncbi:FAD:protein FMN transferase [Thiobacillus sp.]|uniref:FAD:protein FMN transferase n=1 Tax=Thiobacillus sp. TaxID=924 RepID=UPI0017EF9921|nr:FAD:protein FMN transferase [Thiobacillus sp.]MBC2729785.1 FAD:protein FMN transferase [Thiobacillus sp.]MBC2738520.1 FAD:protein FMN transferase [Thiobacillus sp.]MBC2761200.1 FAD:protein FMN transferase [Thiobacillus sp.]
MLNRRDFMKLGLGACLLPAVGVSRAEAVVSEEMYVFGTLVGVDVLSRNTDAARAAIADVSHRFTQQNRDWHAWKPGALGDLNRALAGGHTHEVAPDLLPLLHQARELARASGGLFNPAIGRLVGLWGFHHDTLPVGAPPHAAAVAELVAAAPSMDDLVFDGRRVGSRNPHVQIDLGGHAKGVALNQALDRLAALGHGNALVNLGGNLAVSGSHGDRPWHIGIRHPQGEGAIASLAVSGRMAVVTSGTYERYRQDGDKRYPHIIDPRSGQPAMHVVSATVLHPDAARADVAATALVVAGSTAWPEVARKLGVNDVMIVDEAGRVQLTPGMAARVHFAEPPASVKTVEIT